MAYTPFKKMSAELAKRPGVTNPDALAAVIARNKYGDKAVAHAAATGTSLRGKRKKKHPHHNAIMKFVRSNNG